MRWWRAAKELGLDRASASEDGHTAPDDSARSYNMTLQGYRILIAFLAKDSAHLIDWILRKMAPILSFT